MELIRSRRNPIVSRFRAAAGGAGDAVVLEGARLIADALDAGVALEAAAVVDPDAADLRMPGLVARLTAAGPTVRVTPPVMQALSPAASPSGVVALGRVATATLDRVTAGARPLVIALLGVQDPGNTGAVIRAAEAGGATGVVVVGGADPFGWKAVRGAMGSAFRLPIARLADPEPVRRTAGARGLRVLAAAPQGGAAITETDLRPPTLVWLGAEGDGLAAGVLGAADGIVSVPMRAPVESLNIAVAGALIVYEAARQRATLDREDP